MKNLCTGVTSNSRTHKIQNQSIFSFNDDETKIIVHSLSGIEKQVLTLGGIGAEMCVNGHFLAVSCVPTLLKIYDLSRREAKQLVHKDMAAMLSEIGQITNISINSKCTSIPTKLRALFRKSNKIAKHFSSKRLYFWLLGQHPNTVPVCFLLCESSFD